MKNQMNVPNVLSIFRLIMVPVFIVVFFSGTENASKFAGLIFAIAFFTDVLDGYIARKYNMITSLGKILDPLADKCMTAAALISITIKGIIPVWIVIIFVIKEVLMGLGALMMYRRLDEVIPSTVIGKLATVVFFITCLSLMLFEIPHPTSTVMITVALILTLCALVYYGWRFVCLVIKK